MSNQEISVEIANITLADRLRALYEDLKLLQSGEWIPDYSSCEASLDNIEYIAKQLKIELPE